MKFILDTTDNFYSEEDKNKLEKLGFSFDKTKHGWVKDRKLLEIEIKSLEELISFAKEYKRIVFDGNIIEIYDGYRE